MSTFVLTLRYFKQSWQLLLGLKPNISFGNLGSNIASTIFFTASCTILSSKFAIASPLTFPFSFGILTFLAGFGLYDFVLSLFTMLFRFSSKLKDEIIKYYLDSITDEYINTSKISFNPNDFKRYITKLFTHLEINKDTGILLYKANMIHYLKDEFDRIFLSKGANEIEKYHYTFISGGLYNLYYYWIKNNCKETPTELANMFKDFYILKGDSY